MATEDKKTFSVDEIKDFVHVHIQQKIDANELHLTGISYQDVETFEREFEVYENALFEGICNGIIMCNCEIKGIETK